VLPSHSELGVIRKLAGVELQGSHQTLAWARRALAEASASTTPEDFDYRFLYCVVLAKAVHQIVLNETQNHRRQPDWDNWWYGRDGKKLKKGQNRATGIIADPLHQWVLSVRDIELHQRNSTRVTDEVLAWSLIHERLASGTGRRRISRLQPAPTVRSAETIELVSRVLDQVMAGANTVRSRVKRGDALANRFAGKDPASLLGTYLDWLGRFMLPTAERLSDSIR
jgi:hypothetical protein